MTRAMMIVAVSLLLTGCLPGKWSAYHYEDLKMAPFWSDHVPPQTDEYADYFIEGAFIRVAMRAHDQSEVEGSPPYALIINLYGVAGVHEHALIRSVTLESSLATSYAVRPIESAPDGGILRELSFPLALTFHRMLTNSEKVWTSMKTGYTIAPSPSNRETIVATVDLEIETRTGRKRGSVQYVFSPIYKKGNYTWFDPWERR